MGLSRVFVQQFILILNSLNFLLLTDSMDGGICDSYVLAL